MRVDTLPGLYAIQDLKAYYHDDLMKLGCLRIWEKATVRGIDLSRKTIQRAYKEIHKKQFRGNIIDYLCYICLENAIWYVGTAYKFAGKNAKQICIFLDIFFLSDNISEQLICRLLLKDETYLKEILEKFNITEDEIFFGIIKEYFTAKTNFWMKVSAVFANQK